MGGPVNFVELVARSFGLYRRGFLPLFAFFGAVFTILGAGYIASLLMLSGTAERVGDLLLRAVLPGLVGSFAVAVTARLGYDLLRGRPTTLTETVRACVLDPDVIACSALGACLTTLLDWFAGGTVADPLGLPYLFYGPPLLVHAVVVEDRALRDAAGRARSLASGHVLRALGYLLTFVLTIGIVLDLYTGAAVRSAAVLPDAGALLLIGVGRGVLEGLMLPVLASAMLLLFLDLRARAGGRRTSSARPGTASGRGAPARRARPRRRS